MADLPPSPPVNNFVLVKVLEAENDTARVEHSPGLREDVGMNVHHQVTPSSILHHKADVALNTNNHELTNLTQLLKLTLVWKQANRFTRKGCLIELATSKILFSANKDSTSSLAIMSPFLRALIAKYSPVFLYLARITLPK